MLIRLFMAVSVTWGVLFVGPYDLGSVLEPSFLETPNSAKALLRGI